MTALWPEARERTAVAPLADADLLSLHRLLALDPLANAVIISRVQSASSLDPRRLGGSVLGIRSRGEVVAACYSGGTVVPLGGDAEDLARIAQCVARRPRAATSVVGPTEAVCAVWGELEQRWGAPREFRAGQPLLVLRGSSRVAGDRAVRRVRGAELDRYVPAAAAMFAEELGVPPDRCGSPAAFRGRVGELVRSGRAFARFDERGEVVFKADFGAVTAHTVQVQGVWVRPDLRGRGIGTAALATVLRAALRSAPSVSLYVNAFNAPARRMYEKLGMREHSLLTTVLL
ncbi:MAG: GNAT family N-acetyltransferase [Jatrophihabitans sp.]|nr:MAG: GNAT family N-acetyltransferase [Jatrophihabitans sp.]